MRLILKNIAKVKYADVELNGITVIAGENNSGKSTVGKALYSIFNSLYDIEQQIYDERINIVSDIVDSFYMLELRGKYIVVDEDEVAKSIVDKFGGINLKSEITRSAIIDILLHYCDIENIEKDIDYTTVEEVAAKIQGILEVSEEKIFKTVITKKLNVEFNGQINNIYNEDGGVIELVIKDNTTCIEVFNNSVEDTKGVYSLKTEVVYLDDPFVLDDVRAVQPMFMHSTNYLNHKSHAKRMLSIENSTASIISEIIANDKLEKIYEKINSVCDGDIVTSKRSTLGYRKKGSEKVLNIKNISTGLKTFVMLKSLIEKGIINHNGSIILDEPEIHLHPQWQVLFAELIVLIQKEFDMHILINTHSPYFMNAIEVYSEKYKISDKCKYYKAQNQGDVSVIEDVTMSTEDIYALLARPLQDLENVRFDND